MNKFTRTAATSTFAIAAMCLAAGTAAADPAAADSTMTTEVLPGVRYTGNAADHSAAVDTAIGSFALQNAAAADTVPAPVVTDVADTPPLHNVDATADFNGALGVVATQFGLATGVGTLAGGVVGAGVGCVAGALTGGFVALPTGPIALPAAAFGCVVGASVGIALGSVAGAAILGIPVGIASGVQMYNSLHDQGDI
ncbi:hypothetical protein ACQP1G_21765 [Nocardia sp. CA-107356]|uniref:hypothetical protein n=1 Tax=Nocardia sp. CA-107356 TaxID=3239972 RepID=UPI003D8F5FF1